MASIAAARTRKFFPTVSEQLERRSLFEMAEHQDFWKTPVDHLEYYWSEKKLKEKLEYLKEDVESFKKDFEDLKKQIVDLRKDLEDFKKYCVV